MAVRHCSPIWETADIDKRNPMVQNPLLQIVVGVTCDAAVSMISVTNVPSNVNVLSVLNVLNVLIICAMFAFLCCGVREVTASSWSACHSLPRPVFFAVRRCLRMLTHYIHHEDEKLYTRPDHKSSGSELMTTEKNIEEDPDL